MIERRHRRALLLRQLRQFFDRRDFLEVETPLLADEIIPELAIEPVQVGTASWLQASPELAMKKLMASGCEAIYQITRSFRGDEFGPLHAPEFTILEWYRQGDDFHGGRALLASLAAAVFQAPQVTQTSYAEAFAAYVGVDAHRASCTQLAAAAQRHEVAIPEGLPSNDRDEWLNLLVAMCVQPRLGATAPEILYAYPASQAALATVARGADGVPIAERFELFYRGVELANGYHELTDAAELRTRLELVNRHRAAAGRPALPLPERLLAAMQSPGLPPCAGCALGVDRLAMLLGGETSIHDESPG
jgi:lysyl-tRNA synthetase class 2